MPVLFRLAKEIIFHQTAVIIAIKCDKGIFDLSIGHEDHLFLNGGRVIIPGLEHDRIQGNGFIILLGCIGLRAFWIKPITSQKPWHPH
jgi:hypothetical protein